MAIISVGENRWRMLRRALKKSQFTFEDCRNMARFDEEHFEWLLSKGLIVQVGDGLFELTEAGRAAADLGLYEI